MSISISLSVEKIYSDYYNDSITEQKITNLAWVITGTKEVDGVERTSAPSWGTIELLPPDDENYVPYDQLTRTQLSSWVEQRLQQLDGPDGYDSLWDFVVKTREDDINITIQKESELPAE